MLGDPDQILLTTTSLGTVVETAGKVYVSDAQPIIIPESTFINPAVEALRGEAREFEGFIVGQKIILARHFGSWKYRWNHET